MSSSDAIVLAGESRRRPSPFSLSFREGAGVGAVKSTVMMPNAAAHPGTRTKLTAEQMETKADVTLEKVGDGFEITSVHLALNAKIPGADTAKVQELAGKAKAGCPVSKLLNTKIMLDAKLL